MSLFNPEKKPRMKGGRRKGKIKKHCKVIMKQIFLLEDIFTQVHSKQAMPSHVLCTQNYIVSNLNLFQLPCTLNQ